MLDIITKISRAQKRKKGRPVIRQADQYRDARQWKKAVASYEQAFNLVPWRYDLLIQAGNCSKESGDYATALKMYKKAADNDKSLVDEARKQTDDVHQRSNEHRHSSAYVPDITLDTDGIPVTRRYAVRLDQTLSDRTVLGQLTVQGRPGIPDLHSLDLGKHVPVTDRVPVTGQSLSDAPHLKLFQVGNLQFDHYGIGESLLMGVAAIRMTIVSKAPVSMVLLYLDDVLVAEEKPQLVKKYPNGRQLYIANIWIDCDRQLPGSQILVARAIPERGTHLIDTQAVNVVRTPPSFRLPDSDSFVRAPRSAYANLFEEIAKRPAIVRSSSEGMFSGKIKRILVMRVDQMGDISASLPAMRRLRERFPQAEITAMLPPMLSGIVSKSGLCDKVIEMKLVYNETSESRYITSEELNRVRAIFDKISFDMAIDLCPAHETRRLLLLANAHYKVGFSPLSFPFLDFGVEVTSRDKANRLSIHSHAANILNLVESLIIAMTGAQDPVRRMTDDSATLGRYGLVAGKYIVIHSGARHAINRWSLQNFLELASRLTETAELPVIFFSDKPVSDNEVDGLKHKDRIHFMTKLKIDDFDALLSNACLMVGNDSGPKHLAATRGVPTASIHINRMNWREWGQAGVGIIISKAVPCGGCGLNNYLLCGKDVACVNTITVDEVHDAIIDKIQSAFHQKYVQLNN